MSRAPLYREIGSAHAAAQFQPPTATEFIQLQNECVKLGQPTLEFHKAEFHETKPNPDDIYQVWTNYDSTSGHCYAAVSKLASAPNVEFETTYSFPLQWKLAARFDTTPSILSLLIPIRVARRSGWRHWARRPQVKCENQHPRASAIPFSEKYCRSRRLSS